MQKEKGNHNSLSSNGIECAGRMRRELSSCNSIQLVRSTNAIREWVVKRRKSDSFQRYHASMAAAATYLVIVTRTK